nr:UDP-glucuronosyl/UDP-glucosyltransferase [Tanacetum cinerariifolium]
MPVLGDGGEVVLVGRKEIERVVRIVMEGEEGKKIRSRAKELEASGWATLSRGGSSYETLAKVTELWKLDLIVLPSYHIKDWNWDKITPRGGKMGGLGIESNGKGRSHPTKIHHLQAWDQWNERRERKKPSNEDPPSSSPTAGEDNFSSGPCPVYIAWNTNSLNINIAPRVIWPTLWKTSTPTRVMRPIYAAQRSLLEPNRLLETPLDARFDTPGIDIIH